MGYTFSMAILPTECGDAGDDKMRALQLLELAGYAAADKSIIKNHIDNGVTLRIEEQLLENDELISLLPSSATEQIENIRAESGMLVAALAVYR
jgi:hypothetical protein